MIAGIIMNVALVCCLAILIAIVAVFVYSVYDAIAGQPCTRAKDKRTLRR